jgi:hypothetical protein
MLIMFDRLNYPRRILTA